MLSDAVSAASGDQIQLKKTKNKSCILMILKRIELKQQYKFESLAKDLI